MLEARDVGKAMERLRGDRTQLAVARRAGVNRSSWSSYESGRRMPGADTWERIVAGLGCTEAEFDRAVIQAWEERRAEERGESDAEATKGAGPATVHLSADEALDLASAASRIEEIVQRALAVRGDGRRSSSGPGGAE